MCLRQVKLANGADAIVTTPECLLRMIEKRATDLDRLCHLVCISPLPGDHFSGKSGNVGEFYKCRGNVCLGFQ